MLAKWKNFCALSLSALLAVGLLFGVKMGSVCRLSALAGARTFYLDASSSQALRVNEITLENWSRIRGESVRFARAKEKSAEEIARETLALYNAELLYVEEACGVQSFYAFSPQLFQGVCVNGKTVNLHIAVSNGAVAVGSPIIFDGF